MDKKREFPKSRILFSQEDEGDYAPGEFVEREDPEIDIARGIKRNKELEKRNPAFKAMMDRLRAAAKAVMMFFL